MILHIPHSSTEIPVRFLDSFILPDQEFVQELYRMTDWFTDELFTHPDARRMVFPWSRLLVDVERFADDQQEPMAKVGMGRFYSHTSQGEPLRRPLTPEEQQELEAVYNQHHLKLTDVVAEELQAGGKALIVDCHSFPDDPLPCNHDQRVPRPQICIGTDPTHTPGWLAAWALQFFDEQGFTVEVNKPFAGSVVPFRYYKKDSRVHSIMIELNRCTYMGNEPEPGRWDMVEIISRFLEELRQKHALG